MKSHGSWQGSRAGHPDALGQAMLEFTKVTGAFNMKGN